MVALASNWVPPLVPLSWLEFAKRPTQAFQRTLEARAGREDCLPLTKRGRECIWGGRLSAELSTLLGSVCWSESKASCNLDRAIHKQTRDCYLPNWRLFDGFSCGHWPQAGRPPTGKHTAPPRRPLITHPSGHLFWGWLSDGRSQLITIYKL